MKKLTGLFCQSKGVLLMACRMISEKRLRVLRFDAGLPAIRIDVLPITEDRGQQKEESREGEKKELSMSFDRYSLTDPSMLFGGMAEDTESERVSQKVKKKKGEEEKKGREEAGGKGKQVSTEEEKHGGKKKQGRR